MLIGTVKFPLEVETKDEESVVYTGLYDTEGVPPTKSGERQPVQVAIEVSDWQSGVDFLRWYVNVYRAFLSTLSSNT